MRPEQALIEELAELIAIRSVSPDPSCSDEIRRAAQWVAARITAMGGTVDVVTRRGASPLVVGEVAATRSPERARDVLVYAHYDVQVAGALDEWQSPPFELDQRDGMLYGRGVADDKANLVVLLRAVADLAISGDLPVNVRFLIDGEEEIGGTSADDWLLADTRGASAALLLDGSVDELTVGIRGLVYGHAHISTGASEQHSGLYGGAALSATDVLIRTLSALLPGPDGLLHPNLRSGVTKPTEIERNSWRRIIPGATMLAEAALQPADARAGAEFHLRTRAEPALTIHGVSSGHANEYATTIPVEADANFSLRSVGGQSADELAEEAERLLQDACPQGARLVVDWRFRFDGALTSPEAAQLVIARQAIARSFGTEPALLRSGGSLPLFETLADRGVPIVCTGFGIEAEPTCMLRTSASPLCI